MRLEIAKQIIREYFKDDYGKPFLASDGQASIFNIIFLKEFPRVQVIAPTQYGKSSTIAMALILRSQCYQESFAIVTGQEAKSQIIMEKVIQHTFDDKRLYSQLELEQKEPLERIKRERSKKRITWKCGGEIRTYTADSKNEKRIFDALSGFGSPNIIEDESSLIKDNRQAMIMRMLGGHQHNFLLKIGNPYERNHFLKTWNSDRYQKIFIDYQQALREGRYTQDFIDEVKEEPFFDILYECKFPPEEEFDSQGYRRLLTDEEIKNAKKNVAHVGELRLGFDVSEGGDKNVGVLRSEKYAEIVHKSNIGDLMAIVGVIIELIKKYNLKPSNCFVDATGIGAGVVARLKEVGLPVSGIKWAEKPTKDIYLNKKAENYFELRQWIKKENYLQTIDDWNTLEVIKWIKDTTDKIKIKSKEELRKEGVKSPDVADALALTFNVTNEPKIFVL